ncbi:MAG: ZIP family metal transporter [Candidatus Diapherotrites archaeon]
MAELIVLAQVFTAIFVVSLVSLVGAVTISIQMDKLKKIILYLVSFAAGALLGGAFIHLLPEAIELNGFGMETGLMVLSGILLFFVIEKIIKWRHCHDMPGKCEIHSFSQMSLIGDAVHNVIDGMLIAGSFLVSVQIGISTTIAVLFHELPQEIGDFGILLHGGYSKKKALLMNFLTALTAFLGAIIVLFFSGFIAGIELFILPFAAGGFIYIAGSDLLPEMHKEIKAKTSFFQLIALIAGIAVMLLLKAI